MFSRVRLDPIPEGSFGLRAYGKPVPVNVPLDDLPWLYDLVGVVSISGTEAVVTQTMGKIDRKALADFYKALASKGIRTVRWLRHRPDGSLKPVSHTLM